MKLSVSAYRAQASAHKKILSSSYQMLLNYGATCTTSQSQQPTSTLGLPSVKVGKKHSFECVGEHFWRPCFLHNRVLRRIFGPKGDEVTGEW
jgi:hypothetical protein